MNLFNSKEILSEKRQYWIDYDKGISIILVGYGHSFAVLDGHGINFDSYPIFKYLGYFLYGFRMPLFFIISGLLISRSLQNKGFKGYVSARANNILHPLIIWGIIEITAKLLTKSDGVGNETGLLAYLNLIIEPRKTGVFWYLNALFFIGVIYAFFKAFIKLKISQQVILGFLLYITSAYINANNIEAGFITDICKYYIFFAIGDLVSRLMFTDQTSKWLTTAWVIVPLFVIFVIIQYYVTEINLHPENSSIIFVENNMPFIFLIQALIGCALSLCLSFVLQKYDLFKFIRVIGFHSLFIYCMQILTMNILRVICTSFFKITDPIILMSLTWSLGIIIPMLIYNISIKMDIWWLYTFTKGIKKPTFNN